MKSKKSSSIKTFIALLLLSCYGIKAYAETVTYKQTSTTEISRSEGVAPEGATAQFKTTYTKDYQLTGGNSMTYTLSGFDGCTITGISLKMRSNQSSGAGSLDIKVGDNSIAKIDNAKFNAPGWNGAWSDTYVDIKPHIMSTEVGDDELITISISASENSLYCQSVTIEYEAANNQVKEPLLPASCSFMESMTVEITNNTDGATIYYTTDGSEPAVDNGINYEAPFTIIETTTVKAIAVKEGESSDIVEATYTHIVPECILPEVNPRGGDTPEAAVEILQYSSLTITPAEYNTITYSINDGEPIRTSETTTVSVDEIGDMVLTITSECEDNTLEGTYYYTVVEAGQEVTAILIPDEIKDAINASYNKNNMVKSACGTWKGYMKINDNNIQINTSTDEGYHILSPEFPGKIKTVSVTFTPSTSSSAPRGFVIMPTTYTEKTANSSTSGNLGSASYNGKDNPTSTVKITGDATSFKIYATGGAIYLSQIEVIYEKPTAHVLSVGSTGWATLYLGLDAAIPTGIECYSVSSVTADMAILSPITGTLPAYTGAIIKATANTDYTFKYKNIYAGYEGTNLLQGSIDNDYISEAGYVLAKVNGTVGLYAAELTNGKFLNNANKAYLPASAIPEGEQSNGFRFNVEGTTTIDNIVITDNCQQETIIYDLMGRRMEKVVKGIYIVNGKKTVIK